jgi:hypothetical protein
MNSAMSTFRERTLPAASPFFEEGADGKVFHPLKNKVDAGKGAAKAADLVIETPFEIWMDIMTR